MNTYSHSFVDIFFRNPLIFLKNPVNTHTHTHTHTHTPYMPVMRLFTQA